MVQIRKVKTLTGHRDCVYALQSSGQPDVLFSAGGDGMVVMWDLARPNEGERIAQLPNSIYALAYLAGRDLLVVGQNYEGIHLLDWRNKKEAGSLKLTGAAIFDIQCREDLLFIACGDGAVHVVNHESLVIKKQLNFSEKSARAIAVDTALGEMAVGYSDNHIRIFDLGVYAQRHSWEAHSNSVFTLGYTPDHRCLISGSRDARLKAWDVTPDRSLRQEVAAHLYAINHLAFSPDGKHFVTCSMDKSVKVWQTADLTLLKVIDKARHAGHGTSVNKLLWSAFNGQVVSASDDRTISVWDVIF